jgi:signal peptide peptidase SppA
MTSPRFVHVLHALSQPWLITPAAHAAISELVERHVRGDAVAINLDDFIDDAPAPTVENGVATIPIRGVMGRGLSKIEKSCGACGVEDVQAWIAGALADPQVKALVLDIDSPGGMVNGTPELAATIRAACEVKPVVAHTAGMMCSAAYYAGSQADMILMSESAEIGSIGVYCAFHDLSRAYEAEGVKVELIKNTEGTFKATGFPGLPLTPEQREQQQAHIDAIFSMFSRAVTGRRPSVAADSMRGQTFLAADAVTRGLADEVGGLGRAKETALSLAAVKPKLTRTQR